ncbi:MAG: patatin-like phospholipase family protein [Bacillota bacterium]
MGESKKLGIALSGGAARGLAHIGVLDVLCDAGCKPWCVTGTSAGAIMGALFCCGFTPKEMLNLARQVTWAKLVRPVVPRDGLLDTDRLEAFLRGLAGDVCFEGLKVKLGVVVTDLVNAQRLLVTTGKVWPAVVASCAIPGAFRPVRKDGTVLVDGGVLENVPVRAAFQLGATSVIACDVTHTVERQYPSNMLQVIVQSLEAMQKRQSELDSALADVVIRPNLTGLSMWDLSKADEYYQRGKQAATLAKADIERIGLLHAE